MSRLPPRECASCFGRRAASEQWESIASEHMGASELEEVICGLRDRLLAQRTSMADTLVPEAHAFLQTLRTWKRTPPAPNVRAVVLRAMGRWHAAVWKLLEGPTRRARGF